MEEDFAKVQAALDSLPSGGPFDKIRRQVGAQIDDRRLKNRLTTLTDSLVSEGGETRREGIDAIRSFDPEEFLGADALSAIFDQATQTNLAPQLSNLQARNARRGVRGPLAGATEGDLVSAFRRDVLATVGRNRGQAANLTLGRAGALATEGGTDRAQGLSLFGTQLDLNEAEKNRQAEESARRRNFFGNLAGLAGRFATGGLLSGGTTA